MFKWIKDFFIKSQEEREAYKSYLPENVKTEQLKQIDKNTKTKIKEKQYIKKQHKKKNYFGRYKNMIKEKMHEAWPTEKEFLDSLLEDPLVTDKDIKYLLKIYRSSPEKRQRHLNELRRINFDIRD